MKHLSRGRKRNRKGIPPVAASEKGKAQTPRVLKRVGVALGGSWGIAGDGDTRLGKLQNLFLAESAGKRSHRR